MRWVQHAALRPHKCAAIPFIGNSNAKRGFIDTGYDLPGWDSHVYLSIEAVQEMARMIGWVPAHVGEQSKVSLGRAEADMAQLKNQLAEAERKLAAVEVLKSAGYSAQRKPGRPAKAAA